MKITSIRAAAFFLPICVACVAMAQDAAPSPKQQTLSQKIASDCYNKRRLAIRAVNLKYIALAQAASKLFTQENNQVRAGDADTWAKNLAWANNANLKGIAPDAKDRLGVLQAAYIKERVDAIVTADNACVDDVEAASKKAAQGGDQASAGELAKLEDRIKQELRSVQGESAPAPAMVATNPAAPAQPATAPSATAPESAPAATPQLTGAAKTAADYDTARTDAVRKVNQKYILLAQDAMNLYLKEKNNTKADEAKDWARRLGWTDDGNLQGMSPDTEDRLGILQTTYLRDRLVAVSVVDRIFLGDVGRAQKKAAQQGDQQGAEVLAQLQDKIEREIGVTKPATTGKPVNPFGVAAAPPAPPLTPAEKIVVDYTHARTAAIKQVNDKYAQLSLAAAELFLKEGNPPRGDEAKDWARRLDWTDDGNFNYLTPEAPDRLGALQILYLKERAAAVMTVSQAYLPRAEAVRQQMLRQGKPEAANALADLLTGIKKDLAPPQTPGAAQPPPTAQAPAPPQAPLTPAQKLVADFTDARTAAIKGVNDKYAQLSLSTVDLFVKEGNQPRADEAKDWARRLGWTDDVGNFRGLATDAPDRLGALQTDYLKDRASAVAAVDKAKMDDLAAAQKQTSPDSDMKGAVGLLQTLDLIRNDLGIQAPAAQPPTAPVAQSPSAPQSTPGTGPKPFNPFGVEENKLKQVTPDPQ